MPLGKKKAPVLETQNEKPRDRNSLGFSIPFLYGGLNHRLVTDYRLPKEQYEEWLKKKHKELTKRPKNRSAH